MNNILSNNTNLNKNLVNIIGECLLPHKDIIKLDKKECLLELISATESITDSLTYNRIYDYRNVKWIEDINFKNVSYEIHTGYRTHWYFRLNYLIT